MPRLGKHVSREVIRAPIDGSPITAAAFCSQGAYQMCSSCVMDTTDPDINFNSNGVCNYCLSVTPRLRHLREKASQVDALENTMAQIKKRGKGRKYDCVLGISGGVDSSYLALLAHEWGLRPLAVHVDAGWNSEVAVGNIHKVVEALDLELETVVINWDEMKALQLSYLRSGIANLDVPQDHAFFASLTAVAKSEGISTILSGSNLATESVLPRAWGYDAMDGHQLRAIHRRYGTESLKTLPVVGLFDYYVTIPRLRGIKTIRPLNFINYSKSTAMQTLEAQLGWVDYGGKHYESRWTRYFQAYLLPYRFGYDKRKAHLSSRIISGEIDRTNALKELESPLYTPQAIAQDRRFIAKKLGVSEAEMLELEELPLSHYADFENSETMMLGLLAIWRAIRRRTRW